MKTEAAAAAATSLVFVVDDDEAVRDALRLLLRSVGLACQTYPSAQTFLDAFDPERPGCLLLDVRMPGISGLELAERLRERRAALPILFITGHGDVPMAVQAMQLGAMDFIQKPFRDQDLLDRVFAALERDRDARAQASERQALRRRLATLTPREAQVLERLLAGEANKLIAAELGLSQRTVEIHRARVMHKLEAGSLAVLVQKVIEARRE